MNCTIALRTFGAAALAAVCLAGPAEAKVYRAGLHQVRYNGGTKDAEPDMSASFFKNVSAENSDYTLDAFMASKKSDGSESNRPSRVNPVSGRSWAWNSQYTIFGYEGEMYLEGGTTYRFCGRFDDGSAVWVGDTKVFTQGAKSGYHEARDPGTFTPAATGWYPIRLFVWDWTGGKTCITGFSALEWSTSSSATKDNLDKKDIWHDFADPGDASLLRTEAAYLQIDSIAYENNAYVFGVTSLAGHPAEVAVHLNLTAGTTGDSSTWSANVTNQFAAKETKSITVPWPATSNPYFALSINSSAPQPESGAFSEWTCTERMYNVSISAAERTALGETSATFSVVSAIETRSDSTLPDVELAVAYGLADGGADTEAWAMFVSQGSAPVGTRSVEVGGFLPDTTVYVAFAVRAGGGEWTWGGAQTFTTEQSAETVRELAPEGVYRAGLRQVRYGVASGKEPDFSKDFDKIDSSLVDYTLGADMASIQDGDGLVENPVSGKKWAWNADYYCYGYDGYMYFESGKSYTVGGRFDDGSAVFIDGNKIWSQGTTSGYSAWTTPETYTPLESGWKSVKLFVWDWTGGKKIIGDAKAALMYNTEGKKTETPKDVWNLFKDDGSASLLRYRFADSYMAIESVAKNGNVYTFHVVSSAPESSRVKVFMNATAADAENPSAWSVSSAKTNIDANDEADIAVEWTSGGDPYFTVSLEGGTGYGRYWQVTRPVTFNLARIAVRQVGVSGNTAQFSADVGYELLSDGPGLTLKAYYGAIDAKTMKNMWDHSVTFGTDLQPQTLAASLTDLPANSDVYVRFLLESPVTDDVWSPVFHVSTAPITVSAPQSVLEDTFVSRYIILSRPARAAKDLTVGLSYAGTAISDGTVVADAAQVVFPANSVEVRVPFTLVDNSLTDGARSFTVTATCESAGFSTASAEIAVADDETVGVKECVWTGEGDGTRWDDPSNWSVNAIPTHRDTAKFSSAGISEGLEILVENDAFAEKLVFDTTTAFTIKAANADTALLHVHEVERTAGSSGVQSITANIRQFPCAGETDCTWSIAGGDYLYICGKTFENDIANLVMLKTGPGELRFGFTKAIQKFVGVWRVREGVLRADKNCDAWVAQGASLEVGGGDGMAYCYSEREKHSLYQKVPVTVYTNGVFETNYFEDDNRIGTLTVYQGGVAKVQTVLNAPMVLRGGTVTSRTGNVENWKQTGDMTVRSYASAATGVCDIYFALNKDDKDLPFEVEDGTAEPDVLLNGGIVNGYGNRKVYKRGAGSVRHTGAFSASNQLCVEAGAWYADGSVLASNAVVVAKGATFGGTGTVGGAELSAATVVSAAGESGSPAVIAPGTIGADGSFVPGTLTTGAADHVGGVAFGDYSTLKVVVAEGELGLQVGRLAVNGSVSVSGTGSSVQVVVPQGVRLTPGTYPILTTTAGVEGAFAALDISTVSAANAGLSLVYSENAVSLKVQTRGVAVFVR